MSRAMRQNADVTSSLHLLVIAAMLSVARTDTVSPDAPLLTVDAVRQALDAADSLLAASVEDVGPARGFWPALVDDALFLEPGRDVLRGRDAIRTALAQIEQEASGLTMKLHRVASGRSEDGKLGYTFGWVEQRSERGPPDYAKYLATWRSDHRQWRLQAFARSVGRRRPSPAPEGNEVVAGYHGFVSPADPARLAAQLSSTDSAFAAIARAETTCAAFVAFADRNAVGFGSADFQWGIDAVRAMHSGCTPQDRATWAPVESVSAGTGDLGFTVGVAAFTRSYSKYLTVWARQPDGSWKWLLDTGNARPAPQQDPSSP